MSDTTKSKRRTTRKRVEYAACWPLYLTPEARDGIERIWSRYSEASRAKIMRVLMDLAIEVAERDPAVLLPLMTPQLLAPAAAETKGESNIREPKVREPKVKAPTGDEELGVGVSEQGNPFI